METAANIQQTADQSFTLNANSNAMILSLDSTDDTWTQHTHSNMKLSASNSATLDAAQDIDLFARQGGYQVLAHNGALFSKLDASSDTYHNHTQSNYTVTASNDLAQTADKNVSLEAVTGSLHMDAHGNAMFMHFNKSDDTILSHTNSNYVVSASNNYSLAADKDIDMQANTGSLDVEAHNKAMTLKMNASDDVMGLFSQSNIELTASNDVIIQAARILQLDTLGSVRYSAGTDLLYLDMNTSNALLTLFSKSNIDITSSNVMDIYAEKDMMVSAQQGSYQLKSHSNAMSMVMDASIDTWTNHTQSNYIITASNTIAITADKDISTTAVTGSIDLSAHSNALLLSMNSADDDMSLYAASNVNTTASNDINMAAQKNVNITATDASYNLSVDQGNMFQTMDHTNQQMHFYTQSNMLMSASNALSLEAKSNIDIKANAGYFDLSVDSNRMFMRLASGSDDFRVHTASNYTLTASNDLKLESQKRFEIATNDGQDAIKHSLTLDHENNRFLTRTSGHYVMRVDQKDMMIIDNSNVKINGNLDIQGVLNSTSIVENKLEIQDKVIRLATSSNFLNSYGESNMLYEQDGDINTAAGIVIHGLPSGVVVPAEKTKEDIAPYYEKSLRWYNRENGIMGLGGSDPDTEAIWELKGGAFHLTHTLVDEASGEKTGSLSFGFRINNFGELELIKTYVPDGQSTAITRRVAKFGASRTL